MWSYSSREGGLTWSWPTRSLFSRVLREARAARLELMMTGACCTADWASGTATSSRRPVMLSPAPTVLPTLSRNSCPLRTVINKRNTQHISYFKYLTKCTYTMKVLNERGNICRLLWQAASIGHRVERRTKSLSVTLCCPTLQQQYRCTHHNQVMLSLTWLSKYPIYLSQNTFFINMWSHLLSFLQHSCHAYLRNLSNFLRIAYNYNGSLRAQKQVRRRTFRSGCRIRKQVPHNWNSDWAPEWHAHNQTTRGILAKRLYFDCAALL